MTFSARTAGDADLAVVEARRVAVTRTRPRRIGNGSQSRLRREPRIEIETATEPHRQRSVRERLILVAIESIMARVDALLGRAAQCTAERPIIVR
jgi:hypothetical protein